MTAQTPRERAADIAAALVAAWGYAEAVEAAERNVANTRPTSLEGGIWRDVQSILHSVPA